MGLVFGRDVKSHLFRNLSFYGLISYIVSNLARDPRDQKSVMGYCFFLNGAIILWSSKKQKIVFTSITKAEYITLSYAVREAV